MNTRLSLSFAAAIAAIGPISVSSFAAPSDPDPINCPGRWLDNPIVDPETLQLVSGPPVLSGITLDPADTPTETWNWLDWAFEWTWTRFANATAFHAETKNEIRGRGAGSWAKTTAASLTTTIINGWVWDEGHPLEGERPCCRLVDITTTGSLILSIAGTTPATAGSSSTASASGGTTGDAPGSSADLTIPSTGISGSAMYSAVTNSFAVNGEVGQSQSASGPTYSGSISAATSMTQTGTGSFAGTCNLLAVPNLNYTVYNNLPYTLTAQNSVNTAVACTIGGAFLHWLRGSSLAYGSSTTNFSRIHSVPAPCPPNED
ncbi:MAG: hypothetical protein JNL80_03030 [Phycisphaerae bacterium]|nr:hypothetical protein [Phycisphaerae bacterium]